MPALDLTNKVVCISGASAGIGAACARAFAAAGCRLALGARRLDRLEALQADLEADGAEVFVHPLDVGESASSQTFIAGVRSHYPVVDILINNAGLAIGLDPLLGTSEAAAQTMLDVNVMGTIRLTQGFVPEMVQRGSGHVVMLGSIAGRYFYEGGSLYCATKHAIKALAGSLRLELLGSGVRVSTIDPGMVETEFSEVRFGGDVDRAAKVYAGMEPLTAADIAETILWVCTRPAHVVIDDLLITPIAQGYTVKTLREP